MAMSIFSVLLLLSLTSHVVCAAGSFVLCIFSTDVGNAPEVSSQGIITGLGHNTVVRAYTDPILTAAYLDTFDLIYESVYVSPLSSLQSAMKATVKPVIVGEWSDWVSHSFPFSLSFPFGFRLIRLV